MPRQPGRRVKVRLNQAMARRLMEVAQERGEVEAIAYLRLAIRETTCRVVGWSKGSLTLRCRGTLTSFVVPAGATSPVRSVKSADSCRDERIAD